MTKRTLWYIFHPNLDQSRGNAALLKATDSIDSVTVVNAYDEYPDFNIDVEREQERLRNADLVVFQHPFYWYSTPPLLKKWLDDVLTYGFAYPPKEGTALHGKHWLSVITTGGPLHGYQSGGFENYTMSELLKPLEQSANLIGMRWHPAYVVHSVLAGDYESVHSITDEQLAERAEDLARHVNELDLDRRRSLEPNMPPHFLKAVEAQPAGA